jgi:uncharacterized membrane protein
MQRQYVCEAWLYCGPMQPRLKRSELDSLTEFYSLDGARTATLLELADAQPSRVEGFRFIATCLRIAGVLSLAAGLVFFVAANWNDIAVFGRFALIELSMLACAVLAWMKPPPSFIGRGAVFLTFIATGALLGLFGQTYQTGADVYELFLAWALLGLPLAIAAQWSVASAAWVLVFNAALLLFCGWRPAGGLLWVMLGGTHLQPALIILGAACLNLVLWCVSEFRHVGAVPEWVRRLIVSCAFGFATWGGVLGVMGGNLLFSNLQIDPVSLLILAGAMIVVVAYAVHRRDDIYPLAVVMGTFIIVSIVWLAHVVEFRDEGMFLFLSLWLIGTSTVAGKMLTAVTRAWRTGAET